MPARNPNAAIEPLPLSSPGVTLWRRIVDTLEHTIVSGNFSEGDRLPTEMDLAEQFRVNRHTVRRALSELAERGIVRTSRGSGTFVERPKLSYPIGKRTRFSEIVGSAGLEAGGRLVQQALEPADEYLSRRLQVKSGTMLNRLEILRTAEGVPICAATTWVSAGLMPDAGKIYRSTRSITKMLAHYGITDYQRHETRIVSTLADGLDARRLRVGWHRPILLVESIDVIATAKPVLATRARFAGDRLALVIKN